MKRSTKTVLGLFALLLLVSVAAAALLRFRLRAEIPSVPARTVLRLDLDRQVPEAAPEGPFGVLRSGRPLTLREISETLERAGEDHRVAGLVAKVGAAQIGLARTQEIRDAVKAFRSKRKFAVAFSESFGEFTPGNGAYYLATAFDEIWLQPSGDVGLTGLVLEAPFVRGALDKLGVIPESAQRFEYKNAANTFTEEKFTPAHREADQRLLDSVWGQMVRGIGEGRKLGAGEVRAIVDRGPLLGSEAVEAKLVDRLGYWDEVADAAKAKAGPGAEFLPLSKYRDAGESAPGPAEHTFALIYGLGSVARGRSGHNPVLDSWTMGSETVASAFRKAAKDDSVEAILFRVDSPGGSYVASDTIRHEVARARKAGKPVVVSMGDVAASGGYFVSMDADRIVAQPATLTGSIGVFAGKFVTAGLWEKLGITFDQVDTGANANFWNASKPYSAAEWGRLDAWLDRIYDDFTSKVATGRKLPKELVLALARGRVWTGEDAKERGLVDELGGLAKAVHVARKLAKIPAAESVRLVEFPARKSPFEALLDRLSGEDDDAPGPSGDAAEILRPLFRKLEAAGLLGPPKGVLSVDPVRIR
jgi:protease-4